MGLDRTERRDAYPSQYILELYFVLCVHRLYGEVARGDASVKVLLPLKWRVCRRHTTYLAITSKSSQHTADTCRTRPANINGGVEDNYIYTLVYYTYIPVPGIYHDPVV